MAEKTLGQVAYDEYRSHLHPQLSYRFEEIPEDERIAFEAGVKAAVEESVSRCTRDICDPIDVQILAADPTSTNPINPKTGRLYLEDCPADLVMAMLTLSPHVPNYGATLVVRFSDGRSIRRELYEVNIRTDANGKQEFIPDGTLTDKLKLQGWSPGREGYRPDELVGAKATLYSHGL